jgi:transcriptional regulator with XRE-family HTH domain
VVSKVNYLRLFSKTYLRQFSTIILNFAENKNTRYHINLIFSIITIAERIRLTRQQKNISQGELAHLSDINTKSIPGYELSASILPADALKAIVDSLGVTMDYLVSDSNVQIKNTELFKKLEAVQNISGDTRKVIVTFLDLAICDYKIKQAYSA